MTVVGVDIGGTNTRAGIVGEDGSVLGFAVADTPAAGGPEAEAAVLAELMQFLKIDPRKIDALGIGLPGPVGADGVVHNPPNLKGWGEVDFGEVVSQALGIPRERIFVGNDANLAALAEHRFGNGAGANPMVLLTLGTGVGGAVIIDGKPLLGRDGFAAELGHIVIDPNGPRCGCGRIGCAEALISHRGIVRTAWEILRTDKGSLMWGMLEGGYDSLTPKLVQQAADLGDPAANRVLELTAKRLGTLIADIINIFNPERVVIGGGISRWGDALIEPAAKFAKKQALKHLARGTRIVRAKFYQHAGIIGAATAAREKLLTAK